MPHQATDRDGAAAGRLARRRRGAGTVGGPPLGVYANQYGDGWRSLFVCEDCHTVASNATGWT